MQTTNALFDFLYGLGYCAIPASLAAGILIAVAGVLPSVFLTGANVLLFGPLYGFFISWFGEILGAAVSFYLYRLGFRKRLESSAGKHPILKRIMDSSGISASLLIFEARLLPFIPSGFVTFAASLSRVGIAEFLLPTGAGKIPSIALEALVSYDFINITRNWARLGITVTAIVLILITLQKSHKK